MKTEERHHLHENDLAAGLDRGLRKIEPYSNQILIGILAATVLAVGVLIWQRSAGSAAESAWGQFSRAQTADDFLTVADDFPGSSVADWARLRAGEQFLNQGLRTATSDRQATADNLKNAESAFQSLLGKSGVPPQVRERALYGLAVARETMSSGDTTKAIEAYEALRSEFPQSPYANIAAQRIADLGSEATRSFYAWFDRQPRKPEDRPKPRDLTAATSGLTADPFVLGHDQVAPQPAAHPDRPPSPSLPTQPGETAAEVPSGTPADSTAPAPTGDASAPKGETPGDATSDPPVN